MTEPLSEEVRAQLTRAIVFIEQAPYAHPKLTAAQMVLLGLRDGTTYAVPPGAEPEPVDAPGVEAETVPADLEA